MTGQKQQNFSPSQVLGFLGSRPTDSPRTANLFVFACSPTSSIRARHHDLLLLVKAVKAFVQKKKCTKSDSEHPALRVQGTDADQSSFVESKHVLLQPALQLGSRRVDQAGSKFHFTGIPKRNVLRRPGLWFVPLGRLMDKGVRSPVQRGTGGTHFLFLTIFALSWNLAKPISTFVADTSA